MAVIRILLLAGLSWAVLGTATAWAEEPQAAADEVIIINNAPYEVLAADSEFSSKNLGTGLQLVKKRNIQGRKSASAAAAKSQCDKVMARIPRAIRRKHNIQCEPNYLVKINATPNDTYRSYQYALDNIEAEEAWDTNTGCDSVVVAVIDTGVDHTHPDLNANMWRNPGETAGNGIDDDGNGYVDDIYGYDFANSDANPMDDHDHGTHCAGVIGAEGNNGRGVAGINWHASIMALKFMDAEGGGYLSDAISSINYAVANGAKVLSNSWGGYGASKALQSAIEKAGKAGVLFVAAAGNDSLDNDEAFSYPASYSSSNIVSVAASDENNELAWFSNYGATTVDLAAPGVDILSTVPGGYSYMSGTSMATPAVAGAAGLALCQNPNLSVAQLKALLMNTVTPVSSFNDMMVSPGVLNLVGIMGNAENPPNVPITPITMSGEMSVLDAKTGGATLYKGEAFNLSYTLNKAPSSGVNVFLKVGGSSCAQHLNVNDQSTSVALTSSVPLALKENRLTFILKDTKTNKRLDTVNRSVKKASGKKIKAKSLLKPAAACRKILKSFGYAQ